MLAYSAIDTGTRVFGDTGIRALFDDANQLGKVLAITGASKTIADAAGAIANILTQYAGQLAAGKVLQSEHAEALSGVLSLSTDQQTLAIDFSDELWSLGRNNLQTNILGRAELTNKVFGQYFGDTSGQPTSSDIGPGMKWLWNSDNSSIIDRIAFATTNDALNTTLPDRAYSPSQSKVSIFAAGGQNHIISGSHDNDFIVGGDGNDVIRGGYGKDLLVGGAGDDRLSGGAASRFVRRIYSEASRNREHSL